MKIKIVKSIGYVFPGDFVFPVIVEAERYHHVWLVKGSELNAPRHFKPEETFVFTEGECEIIKHECNGETNEHI